MSLLQVLILEYKFIGIITIGRVFFVKRKKWFASFTLLIMLTLIIAGCANNASNQSNQNSGGKEGKNTVKIGVSYVLSGPFAANGINSQRGALLAIEDFNNKGGVKSLGGAKITAVTTDAGADPTASASAARKLITQDKVSVLIGAYLSGQTLTAATEAERARVPIITQSFADELVKRGYKYTFKTTPLGSQFGSAAITYMQEILKDIGSDINKVAIVSSTDASGITQFEGAKKKADEIGFNVAAAVQYPVGLTSATSIVSKVKSSGAQVLFLGGPITDENLIIQALRATGSNIPVIGLGGGGILAPDFPKTLGKASDYVLSTASWNWDISEAAKEIAKRYVEKYNEPFMPQEAGSAYVEAYMAALAIEKAGSTDPQKIREALLKLDVKELPASIYSGGEIDFSDEGHNTHSYPVMIEYKDGLPYTVWPKDVQQMKPIILE